MVLIYSNIISPRLQYICSFIFKELMGNDFEITNNVKEFEDYDGVKINYSNTSILNSPFQIVNTNLLFEDDIKEQLIKCFYVNGYTAFFKTEKPDFSFDILAASFYLLSRYEEYLPHEKDMYGRYAHENSLAFKEKFLDTPLINIWIKNFADELKKKFSAFNFQFSVFSFIPTYDIDIAYSYKHKTLSRSFGGAIKSLFTIGFTHFLERKAVLSGTKKDPFDTFDWLNNLHEQYNLKPIYFFLVAEKNYLYDKNILPSVKAMKELIQAHSKKYSIGIHPSWQSGDNIDLLKNEINYLKTISGKDIYQSRQHYIRFNLPGGYQRLMGLGIKDDYSMGYGSINGFRASVASSFYWYDLGKEEQAELRIHPFCYMEANSFYEQHFSAEQAYDEMMHYFNICKEVNGTFITLWHNHMVGSDKLYEGWGETYSNFLKAITE
jgi:hypothetical protein